MCPFVVRVSYPLFSGFSWEPAYTDITSPEGSVYCQVQLRGWICLPPSTPTPFNELFRQSARLSLLRLHVTGYDSAGILTSSSIGLAARLTLRPRLTLIRLALIRNPQSSGVRVSHPHYRYLYLHLLFQKLQNGSSHSFSAAGMLPYQHRTVFHSFGSMLMPEYYPRQTARLVSCYALFK